MLSFLKRQEEEAMMQELSPQMTQSQPAAWSVMGSSLLIIHSLSGPHFSPHSHTRARTCTRTHTHHATRLQQI